jgi:hypothetical protein
MAVGARPWWLRSLTRQDLAPTVSFKRGETSVTRLGCNSVGHLWPEALVHGDAAACCAQCALAPTAGRRGPAPVVPTAEREAEDDLRRLAIPPLGQSWTVRHLLVDDKGKGRTLRTPGEGTSGGGRRTTSTKDGRTALSSSFSSVSAHRSSFERPKEAEAGRRARRWGDKARRR